MHQITVIKWVLFRKYHVKLSEFRGNSSRIKNILSFHTAWAETGNTLSATFRERLLRGTGIEL